MKRDREDEELGMESKPPRQRTKKTETQQFGSATKQPPVLLLRGTPLERSCLGVGARWARSSLRRLLFDEMRPSSLSGIPKQAYSLLRNHLSSLPPSHPVLPSPSTLSSTLSSLPDPQSSSYLSPLGPSATFSYLLSSIVPSLNLQSLSPNYYGFVTGSVLPIAEAADNIVTALDQNVQVHFPLSESSQWVHSASTYIESTALGMLLSLLDLSPDEWKGRTFTTGATASNIIGLACGREHVLPGSAKLGLLQAASDVKVREVQILTSMGHSSLGKAASIVGLGRDAVKDVGRENEPWRLDLDAVERELQREGVRSIIVVSAGEVNTGRFATGVFDMPKLRSLADRFGAWIHVDGAFGIFARTLPKSEEFLALHASVAGLELADSIGADGHKLLNVPYDNGIFITRHPTTLSEVFQNANAAYLSSTTGPDGILSPLNIGLENSRRFRALPVYAVLLSEGSEGMSAMFSRMVHLSRKIAAFVRDSPHYEWLPDQESSIENVFMIVMFRARDKKLNEVLVDKINGSGKMFVGGTQWQGQKAVRLAVSTWRVDVERDAALVAEVLNAIAEGISS
ncbi:L-2,4-diaminobutyrate decarboxylase [Podospora australis]|uniref:L-2,4-diaminobutyrate decarboxylase n=1 Tax=Podospora australis TaxID=1536484 RepID=A0AAN6X1E6_9PEZI|nr:L-2,4-diaminobutyrate decarboxylase [Podospora australis]